MSILQNAIDSIQIGIEDYEDGDSRRNVSAVRNISAGTLLLYKEKLCRLSPDHDKELLIKQNVRPIKSNTGGIIFEGKGNKTVDVQSIKERFNSLKVSVDWRRFEEINSLRNDLEHYYTSKSPDAIREIIAKSFLLIRDFVVNELNENPQELIGNDCWGVLLNVAEVYSAEELVCKESIEKVEWKYQAVKESLEHLRCPACHSSLVHAPNESETYPNISLHCKSCNHDFNIEEVIEQCIDDSLSGKAYPVVKDTCLECNKSTFIHSEGCCVACGYEMEYQNCEMCEEPLTLDDQWNEGKCSCCQYKWEKVMAE